MQINVGTVYRYTFESPVKIYYPTTDKCQGKIGPVPLQDNLLDNAMPIKYSRTSMA